MNKPQKKLLGVIRHFSRLTRASIGRPGFWGIDNQGKGFTAAFKFASRTYRRSWLEPAIDALEDEVPAKKIEHDFGYSLGVDRADKDSGDGFDSDDLVAMADFLLNPKVPNFLEFREFELEGVDLDGINDKLAAVGLVLRHNPDDSFRAYQIERLPA